MSHRELFQQKNKAAEFYFKPLLSFYKLRRNGDRSREHKWDKNMWIEERLN